MLNLLLGFAARTVNAVSHIFWNCYSYMYLQLSLFSGGDSPIAFNSICCAAGLYLSQDRVFIGSLVFSYTKCLYISLIDQVWFFNGKVSNLMAIAWCEIFLNPLIFFV